MITLFLANLRASCVSIQPIDATFSLIKIFYDRMCTLKLNSRMNLPNLCLTIVLKCTEVSSNYSEIILLS